jgi:hypothetical protein
VASNKNHHFVPQFYLRTFSPDGRSIGLCRIDTGDVIQTASIRGQCQRAHFYGRDGTAEDAFSQAEGATATVLRDINKAALPPTRWGPNHAILMFHIVSQHARTAYMADEQNEFHDGYARTLLRSALPRDGVTAEDLDRFRFRVDHPVQEALRHILPMFPLTLDLRCVVLVNVTGSALITSDNPVVLYNQLLEERTWVSNTGLQSVGLQIYFPLNASTALFFYDPGVYGVGRTNPTRVVLRNRSDVEQLNGLQVVNAQSALFFDPRHTAQTELRQALATYRRHRRTRRATFVSQREFPIKKDETRELVGFFREDVRCHLRLTFLRTLKRARQARPDLLKRTSLRDPKLSERYDAFQVLVRAGQRQPGDFLQFIRDEA